MAALGYEFYLLVLKYLSLICFAHWREILSALKDKIRIPTWPCNILYLLHKLLFMYNHNTNITQCNPCIFHFILFLFSPLFEKNQQNRSYHFNLMVQDNLFNFFLPLRKELYSCLHGLLGLFLSLKSK